MLHYLKNLSLLPILSIALLLIACAPSNKPPITQTIRPLQTQYPDPVGVVMRDVAFAPVGAMVCLSADDYLDYGENNADLLRWIRAKNAQSGAYRAQVRDNNLQSEPAPQSPE